MKKQVKKWLTLLMAFALILTSVKYSPLSVSATEVSNSESVNTVTGGDAGGFNVIDEEDVPEDIETVSGNMVFDVGKMQMFSRMRIARAAGDGNTYTFAQLKDKGLIEGLYGFNGYEINESGALVVSFEGTCPQVNISLPAEIAGRKVLSVSVNAAGETSAADLALKLFKSDGSEIASGDAYGKITRTLPSGEEANLSKVGIMYNNYGKKDDADFMATAPWVYTFESVTFEVEEEQEEPTGTYTFAQLKDKGLIEGLYGFDGYEINESGALVVSFEGTCPQVNISLPAEIAGKKVLSVSVNAAGGTSAADLALKLFKSDGSEIASGDAYGKITRTLPSGEEANLSKVGIMYNNYGKKDDADFMATAPWVYTFESVTFEVEEEQEEPTGTYTFAQLEEKGLLEGLYGFSGFEVDETGALVVSFEGTCPQVNISLPAEIAGKKVLSVSVNAAGGTSAADLALKLFKSDGSEIASGDAYGKITRTLPSGEEANLSKVGIMYNNYGKKDDADFMATAPWVYTFESVTFEVEEEQEEPTGTYTITVNASALDAGWAAGGWASDVKSAECTEDKRFKVVFSSAQYSQARIMLQDGQGNGVKINLADCKSVTFNVNEQTGPVNFKTWNGESSCGTWNYNSGKTEYTLFPGNMVNDSQQPANYTGEINAIGVQISGDTKEDDYIVLNSIVFTMKKTADQEDQVYGEEPTDEPVDLTVNVTPETTSDSDRRFTIKDGGLVAVALEENKNVTATPQEVEKIQLTFDKTADYPEIKFTLPEVIDLANAKSVTFAVSDQTVPLSFKLYDENDKEINVTAYGKTGSFTMTNVVGRTEKVAKIAVMRNIGDKLEAGKEETCLFDGVLFTMNEEDFVTHIVSFAADELVLSEKSAASCEKVDGKYVMSFAALNQEATFQLPKTMNMENCVSVQITVSGQTGPVNYYLQLDGTKPEAHYYNAANETGTHMLVSKLTTGVNEIRIQCGGEGDKGQEYVPNSGITLEKITFTMKGEDETNDYLEDEEPDIEVVPGTENITPAGDGKDDISYQAGTLKIAGATSAEYVLTDTNQYQVKFAKQYEEIKLNLTTPVDLLQCTGVTFAVSEQSSPLAFKLYMEDGSVVPEYNQKDATLYEIPRSRTGKVVAVGVMMNEADKTDQTCVFDGVCFTMDTSLSTVTELVEFPASELTPGKTQNATYTEVNGEYVIDFSAVNSEMWFTLPETINMANCINVIFEVSGQTQPLNFHVGTEEAKLESYWYKSGSEIYNIEAFCKKEINQVCVQLGDNQAEGTVTLKKVSFLMRESNGEEPEPDEPDEPTIEGTPNITPEGEYSYQAGTLAVSVATSAEYDKTTTNQYQVKFAKQYEEIKLNLATPIDLLQCTGVTFAVSEQQKDCPLAFKLYLEDGSVVPKYDNYGETLYTFPLSRTGKVVAVGVMMNEADKTDQTCVFDGVCFTVDTSLSTVTELVEFPASELTPGKTQNATYTEVNGEYVIDFSAVNSEMWFTLPETVNMANCISVIFEVSGQTQPLNFHVGTEEAKLKSYWYNSGSEIYTLEALCKNKINQVCLQLGDNQAEGTVTLKKVSFLMRESNGEEPEPDEPDEPTIEGTPNITPEGAYSYQAGTLAVSVATSADYAKTTTNQIKADFVSQYKELKLTLPEAINLLQCKSVTFAVSEQSAPLAFKLYNDKNEEIMAKYDQTGSQLYTFDISSSEKVKYVAVMLNQNLTDVSCVFDGVVFEVDPNATTETYTITYQAHELTLKSSEAASCQLENGNWMIKFSDRDQNVNFKLPASVNLEKCVNIIITVATQNGPMNFNVSLDNSKLKDYYYNTGNTVYTLEPGIAAKINEIGVQCGRENDEYVPGSFIELISVSFLMKGTEPKDAPADNNYTMDFLEVSTKSEGVTEVVDENGTATITFPKKDDSITYVIPDSVDTNHLTSMQFLQSLSGVRVEVLNAKGKVIASGTDSILQTNCNPDAKYIRLVSLADDTVLTLNSIKFNVDPDAFEAIVLNGKFDREDVSMWGAALWGSVDGVETAITTKTSDTPIWGDIYTYGEINRRSSPYVCFAQDVSDRTENNMGYIFSFWAKLSDDYKDAPAELRTVEFSPYYIDQNGKTNYSMYRTGAYKQVLEPGEWTHFYGVVNLPGGAQGFVIRIVEQGTNYGQGTCLLGSYAVTGVSLTPTSLAEEPNYKWGGGGSRSNTITKEATCEVTYELKDLSIDWASAKANAEKTGMRAQFTNNYDEVRLKLPRTLDMSTCAYIRLNIPAQNVPIALKLYRKGKQVDVAYYNDITGSYLMVPEYDGLIDAIGIMSLSTPNPAGAYMLADLITFGLTQEPAPEETSNSIIINGDFADDDMSDWSAALWGDGVTITQQTASKPIYGNTYTYATYSRRTSPYQCFAQDITGRVQQNETYTFSFWAKLSNDYKGAPENQRVVQFAPYTVDKNGKENYNPRLDGVYSQVLEPGVWTYFEGTYKVTNDNPISKVVVRILEQGTNYGQGDCVKGSFSVAGVQMARYIPDPPSIDEDVPNLKDAMAEVFGDDFITGTAVTLDEMEDLGIEMLVNKHFNAVTIGNELKPDALFGYSNNEHTPLQTITFNGEKLEVPTLYFGRAEEILDTLKTWNESHPDDPIKVRGHVLVWHSQTPEWFFREGYTVKQNADGSENYVTPEVMNLRLEWYIKTVLEHFTGEDSPYKDMFYGWDVVNEAIYNGYRTDKVSSNEPLSQSTHSANSSWWAVYQSNEFIINAFRFANQYAPADVELYYNDYNDSDNKKVVGIIKLLKDVQEAEGTRIDGMGMQGHYNMVSPTIKEIERAIRDYSEVVDKVMYTEFDMKVGGDISREELLQKEYISQAERYHDIYVLLKKLNAEDGINIGGFTVWGTVDKYSWLQNSSDVGGGASGDLTQCPLLFDSNYKVKPSYWALVDYTMVDPNWTEETTETVTEETKPETPETPEAVETPDENKPEPEPVVESNPVIEEQKKNNPALAIGIAVGAAVLGAGGGAGFYFTKKRKKITK